jgi:hypothetical protein
MKIENQICDLEYAKMLEELGVMQNSYFYHICGNGINDEFEEQHIILDTLQKDGISKYKILEGMKIEFYSAFTVAELGEILPIELNDKYLLSHRCSRGGWWLMYSNDSNDNECNSVWDLSEANARAKMLIYLIENDLVKVEDLNNGN